MYIYIYIYIHMILYMIYINTLYYMWPADQPPEGRHLRAVATYGH